MGNKTLTAVEWLMEEIVLKMGIRIENTQVGKELVEQALALEKEQHDITSLDWFNEGERYAKREKREYDSFEQYFTTKYGKQ